MVEGFLTWEHIMCIKFQVWCTENLFHNPIYYSTQPACCGLRSTWDRNEIAWDSSEFFVLLLNSSLIPLKWYLDIVSGPDLTGCSGSNISCTSSDGWAINFELVGRYVHTYLQIQISNSVKTTKKGAWLPSTLFADCPSINYWKK